jgi:hypothetical protein
MLRRVWSWIVTSVVVCCDECSVVTSMVLHGDESGGVLWWWWEHLSYCFAVSIYTVLSRLWSTSQHRYKNNNNATRGSWELKYMYICTIVHSVNVADKAKVKLFFFWTSRSICLVVWTVSLAASLVQWSNDLFCHLLEIYVYFVFFSCPDCTVTVLYYIVNKSKKTICCGQLRQEPQAHVATVCSFLLYLYLFISNTAMCVRHLRQEKKTD